MERMPKSVITGYSWNIRERVRTKQSMKKNPAKSQNPSPGQNTSLFRLSTHVVQVLLQSSPLVSELRQHFPDCSFLTLFWPLCVHQIHTQEACATVACPPRYTGWHLWARGKGRALHFLRDGEKIRFLRNLLNDMDFLILSSCCDPMWGKIISNRPQIDAPRNHFGSISRPTRSILVHHLLFWESQLLR